MEKVSAKRNVLLTNELECMPEALAKSFKENVKVKQYYTDMTINNEVFVRKLKKN